MSGREHRPEWLSAMLDGELEESEAAWVAAHLEECGECRTELDDLASARAAVRSLPMLDLPDDLQPAGEVIGGPWLRRVLIASTSVAALALVAVGALAVVGMNGPQASLPLQTAEAILAATESLDVDPNGAPAARYLTAGTDAHYRARMTTACNERGAVVDSSVSVTQAGDVTVIRDPLSQWTVLSDGSVARDIGGQVGVVTVSGPAPRVAPGWTVGSVEPDPQRERETEIVTLVRDGVERVRMWVDVETGVAVYREVLGSDGRVACVTELAEFEPSDRSIQASLPFDVDAEVTETVFEPVDVDMPRYLDGLELVGAYETGGGIVAVYGDGVFLVAVLRAVGTDAVIPVGFDEPSDVWESDGETWAILGSIPDDLRGVLMRYLPPSESTSPIVDGWRRIFG